MAASWDFGGSSGTGGASPWDDSAARPDSTASAGAPGATPPRAGHGDTTDPVGAPVVWLGVALMLAAGALAAGLVTDSLLPAVLAWTAGGPLAIGAVAIFVHRDTVRRASPWYAASGIADWGRRVVVLLSLAAVALNAWHIADHLARGPVG